MRHKNSQPWDQDEIDNRKDHAERNGYPVPKWILFCETLMEHGFTVHLYYAKTTVSKYITVTRKGSNKDFLVRFSNHPPNARREWDKDCDFFVGIGNFQTTNTDQALGAVLRHFREVDPAQNLL